MTTSIEKTTWFYTPYKEDTIAVVILAHGLNLLPSKMDQLARFFTSKKCDVLRISLGPNSNRWVEKFNDDYDKALEHAQTLERPLYFVGFSLGALLGVHFQICRPHHQFAKMALIAPATHTHFYTKLPAFLGHFFPKFILPSKNLIEYRSRSGVSLSEYKKMHSLQQEIISKFTNDSLSTPTLLVTSQRDELVSSSKLTKFAESNPAWKSLEISNNSSQLPKKYHHLMIDLETVGNKEWEKLLNSLTEHFTI